MEVLGEAEAVAAVLEGADGLLEGLLVGLADAHHLADGPHLRAELVLGPLELLEGPAGELDDDVVARRGVLLQRAVAPVGDLVEGEAAGELGRDEGDGEARRLGGEGRGAGGARVDLDDDHAAGLRIVGELDVGAADDLDGLDHVVRVLLQPRLELLADRQHGRRAERVAGVHAHGVDVLDEADGDLLVLRVADHLELELLPAHHRLLDEELADQARREAAIRHGAQLLDVVDEPAARAAHGVGRADDHRIAELGGDLLGLLHRVGELALRHVDAELRHGRLEGLAVLATLDGVDVDADDLDAVAFEHAVARELRAQVQARLAAEVGQEGVGPLLLDDLGHPRRIERLDVGDVGHARVGHDRGRVGVGEDDLVARARAEPCTPGSPSSRTRRPVRSRWGRSR